MLAVTTTPDIEPDAVPGKVSSHTIFVSNDEVHTTEPVPIVAANVLPI